MTLRARIADWISGGARWRAKDDVGYTRMKYQDVLAKWCFYEAQAREQSHRAYLMQERLNRIAACETPNANGTVRRMARIAREALE